MVSRPKFNYALHSKSCHNIVAHVHISSTKTTHNSWIIQISDEKMSEEVSLRLSQRPTHKLHPINKRFGRFASFIRRKNEIIYRFQLAKVCKLCYSEFFAEINSCTWIIISSPSMIERDVCDRVSTSYDKSVLVLFDDLSTTTTTVEGTDRGYIDWLSFRLSFIYLFARLFQSST